MHKIKLYSYLYGIKKLLRAVEKYTQILIHAIGVELRIYRCCQNPESTFGEFFAAKNTLIPLTESEIKKP